MCRIPIVFFLLLLVSCGKQLTQNSKSTITDNFYCKELQFTSVQQQADSLVFFMNKAKNSKDKKHRLIWEKKFYCAFPNSFPKMQAIFGYDESAAPLYEYPKGRNVLSFFSHLKQIPPSIYYDKYVRINVNGAWEADNIREAFGLSDHLLNNTDQVIPVFSKFSDDEVISVFQFIFDGPHPNNQENKRTYQALNKAFKQNKRLSKLLTFAYKQVIVGREMH